MKEPNARFFEIAKIEALSKAYKQVVKDPSHYHVGGAFSHVIMCSILTTVLRDFSMLPATKMPSEDDCFWSITTLINERPELHRKISVLVAEMLEKVKLAVEEDLKDKK